MGNENLTDKKTLEEYPSTTQIIDNFRNEIREKIGINIDIELGKKFNQIYDNFDIENVNNNKSIVKEYGPRNKFQFFMNFCDFLICKIEYSKSKKEIEKIQKITSNLATYKGDTKKRKRIKEKRSEVMKKYNSKMNKNGSFRGGQSKIDPNILS